MLEVCINFHFGAARAKKYAKMCKSSIEINIIIGSVCFKVRIFADIYVSNLQSQEAFEANYIKLRPK